MLGIRRREFITLLGGAAAWPLAVEAQQPAVPVVGYLDFGAQGLNESFLSAFRKGMSEAGYVVGQNVTMEYRFARYQTEVLLNSATDLVRRGVTAIVANGTPSIAAAKAATTTIPIVFVTGADPVQSGFVASFNRPGGNVTGVAFQSTELGAKRLELLHELVPVAKTIAFFYGGEGSFYRAQASVVQSAAHTLGVSLVTVRATTQSEIERAFRTGVEQRFDALLIGSGFEVERHNGQIISLAATNAKPTMFPFSSSVLAGGLASYGSDIADVEYRVGLWVGRILKGEKAADLPVVQPTKFELAINLQTAKKINLMVPRTVFSIADRVIE
jgi:putative ABC transport system substrate-binding protein